MGSEFCIGCNQIRFRLNCYRCGYTNFRMERMLKRVCLKGKVFKEYYWREFYHKLVLKEAELLGLKTKWSQWLVSCQPLLRVY